MSKKVIKVFLALINSFIRIPRLLNEEIHCLVYTLKDDVHPLPLKCIDYKKGEEISTMRLNQQYKQEVLNTLLIKKENLILITTML